jgi:hypothetical protein
MTSTKKGDYQFPPKEGFILTHFLTVADVNRSAEFYLRILGAKIVQEGEPELFTNGWYSLVNAIKHFVKRLY